MEQLILTALAALAWFAILRLAFIERAKQEWYTAEEQFRNFQAFAVLKFHRASKTELRNLSIDDLRRNFNVSELYEDLAR